jgi:hypothetical protein
VCKQNLKPSSWRNTLKIIENKLEKKEKGIVPPSKGGKNSKTKTIEHYKGCFLNTQKFFLFCFFAIQVPS